MINLIVVPARGGSKGIPKKNIYPINGKPLLEYTLDVFSQANIEGDMVVSTDSEDIVEVAQKYKNVFVVKRPDELAADNAGMEETLMHALSVMEKQTGKNYDTIITAQPTSPLRRATTIREFIREFEDYNGEYDAQLTFSETKTDFWIRNTNGELERLFPNASRRRQERNSLYIENSMLYITKVSALKTQNSVLGTRARGFIIDNIEGLDINEWNDIIMAEFYIQQTKVAGGQDEK